MFWKLYTTETVPNVHNWSLILSVSSTGTEKTAETGIQYFGASVGLNNDKPSFRTDFLEKLPKDANEVWPHSFLLR